MSEQEEKFMTEGMLEEAKRLVRMAHDRFDLGDEWGVPKRWGRDRPDTVRLDNKEHGLTVSVALSRDETACAAGANALSLVTSVEGLNRHLLLWSSQIVRVPADE